MRKYFEINLAAMPSFLNWTTISVEEGRRRSLLRHGIKINKKVATMLLNFLVIVALATVAPIISIAARDCLQRKLNEPAPIIELVRALIGVNLWRSSNKLLLSILSLHCCILHGVIANTLNEQTNRHDIYDDNDSYNRFFNINEHSRYQFRMFQIWLYIL